jgi:hypothetical protein
VLGLVAIFSGPTGWPGYLSSFGHVDDAVFVVRDCVYDAFDA